MSVSVKARRHGTGLKGAAGRRTVKRPVIVNQRAIGDGGRRGVPMVKAQGENVALARLRRELGWSRAQLARVMNASDRAIVNWEGGEPMSAVYASKLREVQSVFNELKQLMKPAEIGRWLLSDMEEFEGQTPADLVRRGETGRLWASLFYLRSGMPD